MVVERRYLYNFKKNTIAGTGGFNLIDVSPLNQNFIRTTYQLSLYYFGIYVHNDLGLLFSERDLLGATRQNFIFTRALLLNRNIRIITLSEQRLNY